VNGSGFDELRTFVRDFVTEKRMSRNGDAAEELGDDCDLLLSGVLDSLGLLDLMTAFQEHCGREIDFDGLDPELMTVVGPLCDYVAAQMTKG